MSKEAPPDLEELDELGDDAIVAQQSSAHEPQRRVQVQVEARSVVVAEPSSGSERQLEAYDARSDPTVVVRDRRKRAQLIDDADAPFVKKRTNWGAVMVWILAGATAFAVGGLISVMRRSASAGAPSGSAAQAQPSAVPAATENVAPAETAPPAPSASDQAAVPAVDLDQLPVEHRPQVAAAPRQAAHAAPAQPAATGSKPATPPAAKPGVIPEGI